MVLLHAIVPLPKRLPFRKKGAHGGRRLWRKQAVVSPMSKGGPLVRFAHDAERPLRIEDGSGGGVYFPVH